MRGPAGRGKDFKTLVNPPFTVGFAPLPKNVFNLKTQIRLHELSEKTENIPFPASAIEQHHAYRNHGYRIKLEGKTIAYTGDCGFTDKARELAKDADLLICECSNIKTAPEDAWGHLDPIQAGTLAKETNVKKLILTHFASSLYTTLEHRKIAEKEAKKYFPNTTAAVDDMEVKL